MENHANRKRAADDAFNDVKLLRDGISESKVHEQLGKASFSELQELFHLYLDFLRHNNGKLSTFLMSYFDLVEILLGRLRASREGNWALHLSSIRQMIHGVSPTTISIMQGIFRNGYFLLFFHLFHYKCRFANQLLTICLRFRGFE